MRMNIPTYAFSQISAHDKSFSRGRSLRGLPFTPFFALRFAPIPRFSRLDLFHSLAATGAPPLRLLPLSCRAVCTSKGQARKKREGGEGGKGV